ncbi:MAG: EthD family reductase, partial [Candidatus Binatia bacterium]
PIVRKLPGLRRYVQCHTVDAAYAYAEPRWDGVAQIWADDLDSFQRMLDSREFKEESWPDGATFLDQALTSSFVAQEHHVMRLA